MSNPRRTGLAALSALTFAASTPANADVLDTSSMTCGNTIETGLGKDISGVVSNVGEVMGYMPQEASGGGHDLLMTRNALYASASGTPTSADNIMSDLVSQASTDGVNLLGVGMAFCDHDAVHDKTVFADFVGGQAVLVEGLEDYLDGASTDLTVTSISDGAAGCIGIDNATGKVYVISQSSATGGTKVVQEWTSSGLSTVSGGPSFEVGSAAVESGEILATDFDNSEAWYQGVLGSGSYTSMGRSGVILGHASSYESTTGQDFVFYPSASGIEYCEVTPVETPLPPEVSAVDDNYGMSLNDGVSVPQNINDPIELTATCEDPDSPAGDLAINVDASWEGDSSVSMTSTGSYTPTSGGSGGTLQESFQYVSTEEGFFNIQVECADADGGSDTISGVTYDVVAPTASGDLTDGHRYNLEGALLHNEASDASASGHEVTVAPEDGDRLTLSDLEDAIAEFLVLEGGTVEITASGTSLDAQVTVAGISAGAAPEGTPAPPSAGDFEVRVSVTVQEGGTATLKFVDADGTVLYDGPIEGEVNMSTVDGGGDDGGETGGDDGGSGSEGTGEGGEGSGDEGGETSGGDDGADGGSGSGSAGGSEQPSGGCMVAPGTPASAIALLGSLIALARRRRRD